MKLVKIQLFTRGSLFVVEETGFPASGNHFFSPFFRDICQFFSSRRTVFFNEILNSGRWKGFFWLLGTVCVCSVTDFQACGNHFLPFFQAAVKMEETGSRKWKKMVSSSHKFSFPYFKYGISLKISLH